MKIKLSASYNTNPINNVKSLTKNKQVSFCSADIIEISAQTFQDAKKNIQLKYKEPISKLRKERKTAANTARKKVFNIITKDKKIEKITKVLLWNINTFRDTQEGDPSYNRLIKSQKLEKIFEDISYRCYTTLPFEKYSKPNGIMIISKDKKVAQSVLDYSEYYTKFLDLYPNELLSDKNLMYNRGAVHRLNFIKLKDTFPDIESFQNAFIKTLENAEKNYKKTGKYNVLNVENMDRLLDKTINASDALANMRDYLGSAEEEFHTMFAFVTDNPDKLDPGSIVSHRVGFKYDLDKYGIDKYWENDFKLMKPESQKMFEDMITEASEVYSKESTKYIELTEQIETLQNKCKEEVNSLDKKSFKNIPNNTKVEIAESKTAEGIINKTGNKFKDFMKKNKIPVIICAAALLAALGGVMYKKGIFKNLFGKKEPIQKPDSQLTQSVQTNKPAIFSSFA